MDLYSADSLLIYSLHSIITTLLKLRYSISVFAVRNCVQHKSERVEIQKFCSNLCFLSSGLISFFKSQKCLFNDNFNLFNIINCENQI